MSKPPFRRFAYYQDALQKIFQLTKPFEEDLANCQTFVRRFVHSKNLISKWANSLDVLQKDFVLKTFFRMLDYSQNLHKKAGLLSKPSAEGQIILKSICGILVSSHDFLPRAGPILKPSCLFFSRLNFYTSRKLIISQQRIIVY